MCEITYNVKINFENQEDYTFWFNLLSEQKDMLNYASDLIYKKKPKLDIKRIYDYYKNDIGINCHALRPVYLKEVEAVEKMGGYND